MDNLLSKFPLKLRELSRYLLVFVKWTAISLFCGIPIGLVGWCFHELVEKATGFRQ